MKKGRKYFLIGFIALILILGALVSLVIWALNTPEGTRVLLKTISFFSPIRIDAREISGRMRDDLKIQGLRVRWPQGELLADSFHLRWEAEELWNRRLIIHETSLAGVQIKDDRPETGKIYFPGWPETPFWLSRLKGQVDSFRVERMIYQRGKEDPIHVHSLSTGLLWDERVLRVKHFSLDSSPVQAEGSMEMGFSPPRLSLNLQTTPAKKFAGLDSLTVNLRLEPVENREEAKGAFQISGQKKGQEQLRLGADLGLTHAVLGFRNLRLFQTGRKGLIQGEGEIAFSERPKLWLKVMVSDLDLAPELGRTTDLSGRLEIKGSMDRYQGQATFINRSKGWDRAEGSARFRGTLDSLDITDLDAAWLQGSVKGPLKISWAGGISVQGTLKAKKLDPALFNPEWKGEINLNLEGKFLSPTAKAPETSFKVDLLESHFFERTFSGDLEGSWKENLLNIAHLQLRGQGLELQGKGRVQEKFSLEGRITDLSGFIPEAKGEILATGWLRYQESRLSGLMMARGKEILVKGIKAGDIRAELHLKEYSQKSAPLFSLEAWGRNLKTGPLDMPSMNFKVTGSPAAHRAQFAMALNGADIQGELAGAYLNDSWKGALEKLEGRDAPGPWSLQAPARIALSANQFQFSPLTLKSGQGERLKAQADLTLDPVSGSIKAEWQNVDLARANPWITQGGLSGQSSGSLSAEGGKNGWQISGKGDFKGAFAHDPLRVEVSSGQVHLGWDGKGLLATAALKFNRGGALEGSVSSAEAFQFHIPKEGKCEAHWQAIDLGLFQSFLPKDLDLKGKNSGNLSGGWFSRSGLEANGKTQVSRGQIIWKGSPNPISIDLNRAEADFAWRGEEIQGTLALSSPDYGNMKGDFLLPLTARFSPSFHSDEPLRVSFQGQLQENGLLAKVFPEWIQKSRGKMDLNFDASGTWRKPRWKGVLNLSGGGVQIVTPTRSPQNDRNPPPMNLEVPSASAAVDWGPQGLLAALNATLNEKGRIEGTFASSEPARPALPRQGKIDLLWREFNFLALQPFLPEGFLLEGRANGKLKGALLPDLRLDLAGELKATPGKMSWQGEKGLISAGINQAELGFLWRGEGIQGNVSLSLADYGSLKGNFRLPLPAHPPFRFDPVGPVQVSLQGEAQEMGLLSAFFPGVMEEIRGKIDLDFGVEGTWGKPNLQGALDLTNAGAYLPSLGIRVKDLSSRWKLRNGQIQVESLRARSGPGQVEGTGTIWLKGWEFDRFDGNLKGEKFQTFYLPNLQIQSSPGLQFEGSSKHISVRGEILLPEVHIYEVSAPGVVRASPDVVITDRAPEGKPPLSLDIQVRVILGERIQVKAGGIDTGLTGNLDLKILGLKPEKMTARGEIRLSEGTYGGYGLNLRIDRGRFIYAGGPVDNPGLDILALRGADDLEKLYNIRVGVAVFGTLKNPNVKLYSQPAMKDEEILSYLLLGRPYDPKEGNLSLLLAGAGGLLAGDSPSMLEQLKKQVGIDTVDIQAGSGDLSQSMATIGKYLTPQLYVSYGQNMFTNQQILKIRYQISKNWEVETWRGNEMGIDLYYRIDFY